VSDVRPCYGAGMPKTRSWTNEQLRYAVKTSRSYRAVIQKLGLIPAGGNYEQVKRTIEELGLSTEHLAGKQWNRGLRYEPARKIPLEELLVAGSRVQSFKLKNKLFRAGLKQPKCEMCGWRRQSIDGRIPLELDHINGDRHDNRLSNLRVLCPNCHSLQPTHRGKNKGMHLRG